MIIAEFKSRSYGVLWNLRKEIGYLKASVSPATPDRDSYQVA